MKTSDYTATLHTAHAIRLMARNLAEDGAIDEALRQIDHADSVGALVDPTAYMKNVGLMHQDRDTLRAVQALARLGDAHQGTENGGME